MRQVWYHLAALICSRLLVKINSLGVVFKKKKKKKRNKYDVIVKVQPITEHEIWRQYAQVAFMLLST